VAYSVKADVQVAIGGPERLDEVSDHDGDGVADDAVVTSAIAEADALIDSYCRIRYAVPFSSPPEMVRRFSAAEAAYLLKSHRGANTQDDDDKHDRRVEWLRDVGKGLASPGADPPPAKSTAVVPKVIDRDPEEYEVSRENLKGFS
jgi:phage gp36-like protein